MYYGKCSRISMAVALFVTLTSTSSFASPAQTPLETFARLPAYDSLSLSPDGNQAVALRAIQGTYHAVLLDFKTGQSRMLMAADPENFLFNWCRFANPTRVVCSIRSYIVLRAGTIGLGSRWYRDGRTVATRLLAVDTDGKNQLQLIPEPKSRVGGKLEWNSPNQDDVISWLPREPKHILIQLARDDRIKPSVYRLNIYTNKLKRVERHLESVYRWYADDDGRIRYATGSLADGELVAYSFETGKREKLNIDHLEGLDSASIFTLAADGKSSYVIANRDGANTRGLYRIELANAEVVETLLEHPNYDVTQVWSHTPTRQILYAGYNEQGEHRIWFNQDMSRAIAGVREQLGNPKFLDVWSATPDLGHLVLYVQGNGVSPSLYRFSVKEQVLLKLAELQQGPIVDFEYVTYKARDGLEIPAYLALPGPPEDGPYPTIIDPHGGPWAEDTGSYSFLNQYFLDRGYALLKPNFRGSTGYGDAYTRAGFGEWGGKMQDDVIDGLDWMIEHGLADPERVCIHGGSYGGYVALVAAYKTPAKFQCAISFAGVTDLADLKTRWYNFRLGNLSAARLPQGNKLVANSPIENVAKMKLPLLIVHGDVDRSVMIEQGRSLTGALDNAKVPHTYIEQTNGDHFFSLQAHRLEYLQAVEAFLEEHMGD